MKKGLAVFSLLLLLSVPAMAAPRGDDSPRGGGGGVVSRVVHLVKKLVGAVIPLDEINPAPPHP
jgi:hypothetical protein